MPHPISLLPALPGLRPLDAPCTGRSRSQHPPSPPGRLRLHCVCVCVLVDVMSQCRLMCPLLSGRLPFAKRLLPRSVVLAAVSRSPSISVPGARVMGCSPSRPSGVLGDVMFLRRLMCFLSSGRLPFAMRLLPRYVVSAADLLSLSDSVSGARVIWCSPSRLSYYAVVCAAPVPTRHSFLRICKFGRVYSL